MNWLLFATLGTIGYVGVATMGYLGGGPAETFWDVLCNAFQPKVVVLMLGSNGLWIMANHYGQLETKGATSMLVALGLIIIFAFYAVVASVPVTLLKLAGVALVLLGIYCLA